MTTLLILSAQKNFTGVAQATPVKSLHWLEHSDHVITMGLKREEVFELAITFMESSGPAAGETSRSVDALRVELGETSLDR